ncbi:TetR/AcrR family transcriptional regulator [Streptomyces sp. NPDC059740]|uniref:TetR/AcrR family transcriptional regulator n=1 Tax=Streptomyces sp. NPDC059740 TaxID=3346926 RepID=UPI003648B7F7
MTSADPHRVAPARGTARRRGGLAEKRSAILRAALTVFGRDGYTRASVGAIAQEAEVSTRTLYNHFGSKAQVFLTVIEESATQVRDAQLELIERFMERPPGDPAEDLTVLARAWASPLTRFPDHFALVRQVNAEAGHIPREVVDAWLRTGPQAAMAGLARSMQVIAERIPLHIDDVDAAASHLVLLTGTEITNRSFWGAYQLSDEEVEEIIRSGVHTFLYGYLPRQA